MSRIALDIEEDIASVVSELLSRRVVHRKDLVYFQTIYIYIYSMKEVKDSFK